MGDDDDMDDESDRGSVISAIRKTRSIDASCLDMRSIGDVVNCSVAHMPRAKSEFNLTSAAVEGKTVLIIRKVKGEILSTFYSSSQMGSAHHFSWIVRLSVVRRESAKFLGRRQNCLGW